VLPADGGKALRRSKAAFYVGQRLSGWWPYLVFFVEKMIPDSISDFLYDFVALRRYSLFGRTNASSSETCLAPTRKVLERFLDAEEILIELKKNSTASSKKDE